MIATDFLRGFNDIFFNIQEYSHDRFYFHKIEIWIEGKSRQFPRYLLFYLFLI